MSEAGKGLSTLRVADLAQTFVDSVRAKEATEHIGRKNRFAGLCAEVVRELKARGTLHDILVQLAGHQDKDVQACAKSYLAWLGKPPSEPPPRRPLSAKVVWQCDHPPPPAATREETALRLRRAVPQAYRQLLDLARPAVGLWPQRCAEIAATASRFGGAPVAPPGWTWPVVEEEPLLFIGQINCAELRGLPGAEALAGSGLLSFFGDHDAVTGCFPFDSHCVFHWPDVDDLVPAKVGVEPIEVFPSCALALRPVLDLPHPYSTAVNGIGLSKQQRDRYFDTWIEIRQYGIPHEYVRYASFSKLFGWPALVQSDLQRFQMDKDARLLLEVDPYCNGAEHHDWGPGGSLFYVLSGADWQARAFARAELEGQFT